MAYHQDRYRVWVRPNIHRKDNGRNHMSKPDPFGKMFFINSQSGQLINTKIILNLSLFISPKKDMQTVINRLFGDDSKENIRPHHNVKKKQDYQYHLEWKNGRVNPDLQMQHVLHSYQLSGIGIAVDKMIVNEKNGSYGNIEIIYLDKSKNKTLQDAIAINIHLVAKGYQPIGKPIALQELQDIQQIIHGSTQPNSKFFSRIRQLSLENLAGQCHTKLSHKSNKNHRYYYHMDKQSIKPFQTYQTAHHNKNTGYSQIIIRPNTSYNGNVWNNPNNCWRRPRQHRAALEPRNNHSNEVATFNARPHTI